MGHLGPGGGEQGKKALVAKASPSPQGDRRKGNGPSWQLFSLPRDSDQPWKSWQIWQFWEALHRLQEALVDTGLGSVPSRPHLWACQGGLGHTHQLVGGGDREIWGPGLRGQKAGSRPREGRGLGEQPAEVAAGKRAPVSAKRVGVDSAVGGSHPAALRTSGAHLPLSLCPGRAELGPGESPFTDRGVGNQGFIHHPRLGSSIPGWTQSSVEAGEGREGVVPGLGVSSSPSLPGSLE